MSGACCRDPNKNIAAVPSGPLVLLTGFCPPHRYGMRFIAKVLKDSLHEKFPDAGEDELLKVSMSTLAGTCPLSVPPLAL